MIQQPRIIGICGKKSHGKDTTAKILQHMFPGAVKYAFADPLKKGIQAWFDFSDEQIYGTEKETIDDRYGVSARSVLQLIGTDWVRNRLHSDLGIILPHSLWIERFHQFMMANKQGVVIISDVRFPDEVEALAKYKGAIILSVDRSQHIESIDNHASENTELVKKKGIELNVLVEIDNNKSLSDLELIIKKVIEKN